MLSRPHIYTYTQTHMCHAIMLKAHMYKDMCKKKSKLLGTFLFMKGEPNQNLTLSRRHKGYKEKGLTESGRQGDIN